MREDEYRQLAEQRMNAIEELRTFNEAAQQRAGENNGEMLAEDEAEFDKREKEVVALTKRLTTEQRTRYAVQAKPEAEKWMPAEKEPETFQEPASRSTRATCSTARRRRSGRSTTPEIRRLCGRS